VVGWSIADHLRTELVLDALDMARIRRKPPAGTILHSDTTASTRPGHSASGCARSACSARWAASAIACDNAAAESFFGTLKNEMYYRRDFPTRAQARSSVADYIEVFYNRRRLHSTLGYQTPAEALSNFQTAAAAA
jgi:putative transposase